MKFAREGKEKADKEQQEKSEEKKRKRKIILNVLIVIRWDTTQVNAWKRSQRIPVGAQWGLCNDVFVNHSPVEEDLEQTSAHHREQLHSEEKNSEVHSEVH